MKLIPVQVVTQKPSSLRLDNFPLNQCSPTRMGYIGSGLSGLMQGMGPQYQFSTQPNPSPLATALGIGAAGAGMYRDVMQGMKGFST